MSKRTDSQLTGLAGEFFVAAELLKRGLQTSVTFGNAKAIDLLAYNPKTGRNFTVQVKALRQRNYFLIDPKKIEHSHVYVFVILNMPGKPVEYFVVSGKLLNAAQQRFDQHPTMPGIHPKNMEDFRDKWDVFSQ